MEIARNIQELKQHIPAGVTLVAVSKTHPAEKIMEAFDAGQLDFGENRVQEMNQKRDLLPKDIRWHLIGHLQTNKVKDIAPYVSLIHSVDSLKLLQEVNKQAMRCNRSISCLLQMYIASEESKFGLDFKEASVLLASDEFQKLGHIRICGLMGMATNTTDTSLVRKEFASLRTFFEELKKQSSSSSFQPEILSMGMSSDYRIAIEEGSTMIRLGNSVFGSH